MNTRHPEPASEIGVLGCSPRKVGPICYLDWAHDGRYLIFQGPSGEGTATDILYLVLNWYKEFRDREQD